MGSPGLNNEPKVGQQAELSRHFLVAYIATILWQLGQNGGFQACDTAHGVNPVFRILVLLMLPTTGQPLWLLGQQRLVGMSDQHAIKTLLGKRKGRYRLVLCGRSGINAGL